MHLGISGRGLRTLHPAKFLHERRFLSLYKFWGFLLNRALLTGFLVGPVPARVCDLWYGGMYSR